MEVEYQGFCSRQVGAVCSMCLGLILVPCTVAGIFWNESDAVLSYATSDLVWKTKDVAGCNPTASQNDELVLAACDVKSPNIANGLPDVLKEYVPSFEGSEISWTPEVYLYQQTTSEHCTKDNHGGKVCTKTYSCSRDWTETYISSQGFKCPEKTNNNPKFPLNMDKSGSFKAKEYSVSLKGSSSAVFALDADLQKQLPEHDLSSNIHASSSPTSTYARSGAALQKGNFGLTADGYLATYTGTPKIGDVRIKLSGRSSPSATVAAKQQGMGQGFTFVPWPPQRFGIFGKKTKTLEKLLPGKLSTSNFAKQWQKQIEGQTWLLRIICLVVMIVAFQMIFAPLSVAADLLRMLNLCTCCMGSLLDDMAQCAIHMMALAAAVALYVFAVAVAWIVARPAVGAVMLGVCGLLTCLTCCCVKKNRRGGRQVRMYEGGELPLR